MSGFVQPQWSGFSMPDASAFEEARHTRRKPGHELDRIALTLITPALGPRHRRVEHAVSRPAPVTPASPRPDKALIP